MLVILVQRKEQKARERQKRLIMLQVKMVSILITCKSRALQIQIVTSLPIRLVLLSAALGQVHQAASPC